MSGAQALKSVRLNMDLFLVQKIDKWAKEHGIGFNDAVLNLAQKAVDMLAPASSSPRKRAKKILAER